MNFQKSLASLQDSVAAAIKKGIKLNKKTDDEKSIYDYKQKQKAYYLSTLNSAIKLVKSDSLTLPHLAKHSIKNQPYISQILGLIPELESKDIHKLDETAKKIADIAKQLDFPKQELEKRFSMPSNLPAEISPDIEADIIELSKCFNSGCYRSSIILCGRLLETALHRKYYELTKNDLLEKSPGIGLGSIISKLKEKNIGLDPALINQIHLINQVRIFSVHKKKQAFYPTKQQTEATILYTLDVLEKLF